MKLYVVVKGRVQGVGFRWWVQHRAADLGLDGWVRNLPNRSVEVLAFGPAAALDAFEERLREGPPGAYVQSVAASRSEGEPEERGFRIEFF
jgi:acylphosphatase